MSVSQQMRTATLGEVAASVTVGHVGTTSKYYAVGGIPFLRTQNVGNGMIDRTDLLEITPEFHATLKKSVLRAGDVIISRVISNEIRCAVVPDDLDGANCANIIKIEPGEAIDSQFLMHFVASPFAQRQLMRTRVGSAQSVVNTTVIKKWKIPLPPLAEQKRIAGILDAADALRAKRREALAQLDTLLQSTFLDMFGDPVTNPMEWEVGKLADVVERLDGGKNVAQSQTPTEYRVLKVSAVTYGVYRPEESKYLPTHFDVPESYLVKKGDLLISRANTVELIGATAYVWDTPQKIALPDKIWKFIWKKGDKIEPLFIYHLSQNAEFRRVLGSRASGTSGSMKNIAKPKLLGLPIPLPPLDLQRRFAAIVESVEQHKARMRAHLTELDALFASLQSRAFNGEL